MRNFLSSIPLVFVEWRVSDSDQLWVTNDNKINSLKSIQSLCSQKKSKIVLLIYLYKFLNKMC
jgi:hypothetical protein